MSGVPPADPASQVADFIGCLYEPEDLIEVRCILPQKNDPERRWLKAKSLASPTNITWMTEMNARGFGVYVGINPRNGRGGKSEDVATTRCHFVDIDENIRVEDAVERISHAGLPSPTVIVQSGHGIHVYWRLAEPLNNLAEWRLRQESLIALVRGADCVVKDPPRVMRLPGFLNTKPATAPCQLALCTPERRYNFAHFPKPMEVTRLPAPAVAPAVCARLSRTTLEFIAHGAADGERNSRLFRAAADMAGSGYSQAEAESKLLPAATTAGLTNQEVTSTIASAYARPRTPSIPHSTIATFTSVASDHERASAGDGGEWPEPMVLAGGLPSVLSVPPEALPGNLRGWALDIADRVQCPLDFVAVSMMVAVAAVVGRQVAIRPKRCDDWTVVPNLWGAVVGRPGVMKSPAIAEPLRFLRQLDEGALVEYKEAQVDHKARVLVADAREKDCKKRLAQMSEEEALAHARQMVQEFTEGVARRRYIVNDTTIEKLGEILNQNPRGVLIFRDELIGFLLSLEKEGQESSRAFYLEAWNGNGAFTFDRIGRGTIDIQSNTVSVLGGIQPGPLQHYLWSMQRGGRGDDGLMQRFQLLVWPDIAGDWKNVDRQPDTAHRDAANRVFMRLDALDPQAIGAQFDTSRSDPFPFLRFAPDAQECFASWRSELEPRLRGGNEHPAIEAHLSKYRSLIPSLALLIHLAEGAVGPVAHSALERALQWGTYLESHARRLYAAQTAAGQLAGRLLAQKILDRSIGNQLVPQFALRNVYRNNWTGLSTPELAREAAAYLVDQDWLREERVATAGRDANIYFINPRVFGLRNPLRAQGCTDRADRSPPPTPFPLNPTTCVPTAPPSVGSVGAGEGTAGAAPRHCEVPS